MNYLTKQPRAANFWTQRRECGYPVCGLKLPGTHAGHHSAHYRRCTQKNTKRAHPRYLVTILFFFFLIFLVFFYIQYQPGGAF